MKHETVSAAARERGLAADSPAEIPGRGWWEIMKRVWTKTGSDNVAFLSAAVAFYAFLAFVPLLASLIMTYGLVADPATVSDHMRTVIAYVPDDAARLINEQLLSLTQSSSDKTGVGLAVALLFSIYGAMRAATAIIAALNIIYEQKETRGIIETTLLSAAMTIGIVLVAVVGLLAASILGYLGALVRGLGPIAIAAIKVATWIVAAAVVATAIAVAYRIGPDRHDAKWRWLSHGSIAATLLWVAATLAFGLYAANFTDYNATYGSLGAVVVLLMWFYLSAYAVLLGAELNAESERQTLRDSTTGPPRPIGERGATVADSKPPAQGTPAAASHSAT